MGRPFRRAQIYYRFDHQKSVIAIRIVVLHALYNYVAELYIKALRADIGGPYFKSESAHSIDPKAVFHTLHEPASITQTPLFRRHAKGDHMSCSIALNKTD